MKMQNHSINNYEITQMIKSYGINNWPVKDKIYMHILKARESEPKILSFINNLKFNRIDEYNPINIT